MRADTLFEQVRSALAKGDLRRARQVLGRVAGPRSGYREVLKFGLSSPVVRAAQDPSDMMGDAHLFDEVFAPRMSIARPLQAELSLRRTFVNDALFNLNSYVTQNPEARKLIRDDPRFAPLRRFYEFRVLTGLQEPLTVSEGFKQ